MSLTIDENSHNNSSFIIEASSKNFKRYVRHVCNNKKFSDITFLVGKDDQKQRISAHKLILCSWSSVFQAMFCGSLATNSDEIAIPDVEPTAFLNLINFVYFNQVKINQETVMCTLYAARKYDIYSLEKKCVQFLNKNVDSENIFILLKQARFYDLRKLGKRCINFFKKTLSCDNCFLLLKQVRIEQDPALIRKCLQMIAINISEAFDLNNNFVDLDLETLILILEEDTLQVFESKLFKEIMLWSRFECYRKQLSVTSENQRHVLGRALYLVQFSMMTSNEFEKEPVHSGLLFDNEIKHFREGIASNKYFTERPRCSISPIELRLKFKREMKKFPRDFLRSSYFIIKKPIFVTGFIILNLFKSNVVQLELWSLTNHKKYGEFYVIAKPANTLTSSVDTLTFIFDKPHKLSKRNYGMALKYDQIADYNELPNWRLLPEGTIDHSGNESKKLTDYFQWSKDNDFVSEIIFYE